MNQIKIDPDDKGIWRRVCCVWPGKTLKSFYEGLDTYVEKFPNEVKPVIYCSEAIYKQIKNLPEAFRRGRWLYVKYCEKTFLVKKVRY